MLILTHQSIFSGQYCLQSRVRCIFILSLMNANENDKHMSELRLRRQIIRIFF